MRGFRESSLARTGFSFSDTPSKAPGANSVDRPSGGSGTSCSGASYAPGAPSCVSSPSHTTVPSHDGASPGARAALPVERRGAGGGARLHLVEPLLPRIDVAREQRASR